MIRLIIFCCLLFYFVDLFACEIIDDSNKSFVFTKPVQRVISLAPDITELLFSAGANKQVVGVMQGSDWPSSVKHIPVVAAFDHIDAEKILALHPDLIIAPMTQSLNRQLEKISLPVFYIHIEKLQDIPIKIRQFGCMLNTKKTAETSARQFEHHYDALLHHYKNTKKITVFYEVWSKPLFTVSKNNWIDDVIILCGGQNIFADIQNDSPEVNIESVITRAPDVIIGAASDPDWQNTWKPWTSIPAVKQHYLFSINPDEIERAGPRVLDGADRVCQWLAEVR